MKFVHRCLRRFADARLERELSDLYEVKAELENVMSNVNLYRQNVHRFGTETSLELTRIALKLESGDRDGALAQLLLLRSYVRRETDRFSLSEKK